MKKLTGLIACLLISAAFWAQDARQSPYSEQEVKIGVINDSLRAAEAKWDSIEARIKRKRTE